MRFVQESNGSDLSYLLLKYAMIIRIIWKNKSINASFEARESICTQVQQNSSKRWIKCARYLNGKVSKTTFTGETFVSSIV